MPCMYGGHNKEMKLFFTGFLIGSSVYAAAAAASSQDQQQSAGGAAASKSYMERTLSGISRGIGMLRQLVENSSQAILSKKRPPTRIKVACVGLGRTGTTSFVAALQELGYTSLHDDNGFEASDILARAYRPENPISNEQFANELGEHGFDAVFWYSNGFIEWAANQEDVKVVLTVRDSAEKWVDSWLTVAYGIDIFHQPPYTWLKVIRDMLPGLDDVFKNVPTGGRPELYKDRNALMEGYEMHIEKIKSIVPPERLLIFNVKQGWEPLCEFLDKPVPNTAFPHVNDRVAIRAVLATMWSLTWIWPLAPLGMAVALSSVVSRLTSTKTLDK